VKEGIDTVPLKKNDAVNLILAGKLTAAPDGQSGTMKAATLFVVVVLTCTARECVPWMYRLVLALKLWTPLFAAASRRLAVVLIHPSLVFVSKFHTGQPPHEREYPEHVQLEPVHAWFVSQQVPPQLTSVALQQMPPMHSCEPQD